MTELLWLIGALLVLGAVWKMSGMEKFQPEMLDKSQVRRTVEQEHSSYDQATNDMPYAPYDNDVIPGQPTPYRVNAYKASM